MGEAHLPWNISGNAKFRRLQKKYARNAEVSGAVESRIEEFRMAPDPARIGDKKIGAYGNMYGIAITKSIRLLYVINYKEHEILLTVIGDHKEAYEHD